MTFSKNSRVPVLVGALLGGLLLAPHASATVSGTLNNAGGGQDVTVSLSVIDFHPGPVTGTFVTSGGTNLISPSGNVGSGVSGTIKDLAAVNQPPITNFMIFSGSGIVLDLAVIGPGSANTNCSGLNIGDSCSIFPGSPFILTLAGPSTTGVSLSVSGAAHDGTPPDSHWMGAFTTQLVNMTPAQVQNLFGCAGAATPAACTHQGASITSSWSGSFIVIANPPPPRNVCPLTQGFWKNHPNAWPVTSLQLGSKTYTEAELLVLFGTAPKGDASLILAHQLIAAKLNVANGTSSIPVLSTIAAADALLATFSGKLPYNVPAGSVVGQQMTALSATLDSFNNGAFNPGCVD
jgi:hypothetical protein